MRGVGTPLRVNAELLFSAYFIFWENIKQTKNKN